MLTRYTSHITHEDLMIIHILNGLYFATLSKYFLQVVLIFPPFYVSMVDLD